jgi:hypothetical protein
VKRLLATLAAATTIAMAKPAHALEGPCRGLSVPETITCAARKWPVPGGAAKARAVADCESGMDPRAVNGRFSGVYQIGDTEWSRWLAVYPEMKQRWVSGILHGRSNALVAVRTVHRIGSWKPWSCA